MRNEDIEILTHFLTRMGMYICPRNKDNVVSFLHGYEAGSLGQCSFTEIISDKLEKKYKNIKQATGWPGQIDAYAESKDIDWMSSFQLIGSEVLNESLILKNEKT